MFETIWAVIVGAALILFGLGLVYQAGFAIYCMRKAISFSL